MIIPSPVDTQEPRQHQQRRRTRAPQAEQDWVEQAELHIEKWAAAHPPSSAPLHRPGARARAWANGRGDTYWRIIMGSGLGLMGLGLLVGHGLYDVGEAILFGGGGAFGMILFALETGGVPV